MIPNTIIIIIKIYYKVATVTVQHFSHVCPIWVSL